MRHRDGNENAISTFLLKVSRKLRDYYQSGLAEQKVTGGFLVWVCLWADFMGKFGSHRQIWHWLQASRDARRVE